MQQEEFRFVNQARYVAEQRKYQVEVTMNTSCADVTQEKAAVELLKTVDFKDCTSAPLLDNFSPLNSKVVTVSNIIHSSEPNFSS